MVGSGGAREAPKGQPCWSRPVQLLRGGNSVTKLSLATGSPCCILRTRLPVLRPPLSRERDLLAAFIHSSRPESWLSKGSSRLGLDSQDSGDIRRLGGGCRQLATRSSKLKEATGSSLCLRGIAGLILLSGQPLLPGAFARPSRRHRSRPTAGALWP